MCGYMLTFKLVLKRTELGWRQPAPEQRWAGDAGQGSGLVPAPVGVAASPPRVLASLTLTSGEADSGIFHEGGGC